MRRSDEHDWRPQGNGLSVRLMIEAASYKFGLRFNEADQLEFVDAANPAHASRIGVYREFLN